MAIKFAGITERSNTFIVDGYSDRKTEAGAIKDFGRFIEKRFHNGEGKCLIDMVNMGIDEYNTPIVKPENSDGGYLFTIEEVGCASNMNEATGEMEYADGHFYIQIRFVK